MVALRHPAPPATPAGWEPMLTAVAASPGEEAPVLALADHLDAHDNPAGAAAVRGYAPDLVARYRAVTAFLDAALAAAVVPVVPRPRPRAPLSAAEWVGRVRDALCPLALPGLTVVRAGFGGGATVELRHPPGGFALPDGRGGWVPLTSWLPTWREAAQGARLGLDALLARLFPDEPRRIVHADGDTFDVPFWRVVPRPARRG